MILPHSPLRLTLDSHALISNWRWLDGMSGPAACGAAIKADGYGTGARDVLSHLAKAGCRDFFVATWAEAEMLLPLLGSSSLSVLHGFAAEDLQHAIGSSARPVLNTPQQVQRWREQGQGRPCDVMVDTGMNRLGLSVSDIAGGLLDGLNIEILMSHLASADEDSAMNRQQLETFRQATQGIPARRRSLANSAGICLGSAYCFDLTRPGLALYGGVPRAEAKDNLRQVARVEAQIVQRRTVERGDSIGYNALFLADRTHEVAILNIGYADGYLCGFSNRGRALINADFAPVAGRVWMDLTAILVDGAPELREGDWVEMDFDLPSAAVQSGLSQYELLTNLGARYRRNWI